MNAVKIEFTIAAAKGFDYDESGRDGPNWSYIDSADNCADALAKFNSVRDYLIVEFYVETTWSDGSRTRNPVFGSETLVNGQWVG